MTIPPLKVGFPNAEMFDVYVKGLRGFKWKPVGVTLHNTFHPNLARVQGYLDRKEWNEGQLIDNWWVRYKTLKWYSGPHLFVFPTGIWAASPLTDRGTHSPSFNRSYFGVEIIGDFSKETLPDHMRVWTVKAIASLYRHILKTEPSGDNFKFHGEDPRTSHKGCPGKNIHPKARWVEDVKKALAPR